MKPLFTAFLALILAAFLAGCAAGLGQKAGPVNSAARAAAGEVGAAKKEAARVPERLPPPPPPRKIINANEKLNQTLAELLERPNGADMTEGAFSLGQVQVKNINRLYGGEGFSLLLHRQLGLGTGGLAYSTGLVNRYWLGELWLGTGVFFQGNAAGWSGNLAGQMNAKMSGELGYADLFRAYSHIFYRDEGEDYELGLALRPGLRLSLGRSVRSGPGVGSGGRSGVWSGEGMSYELLYSPFEALYFALAHREFKNSLRVGFTFRLGEDLARQLRGRPLLPYEPAF